MLTALVLAVVLAQLAPSQTEVDAYTGLMAAAFRGDAAEIQRLLAGGASVATRDGHGRTPLHVAAHAGHHAAARALLAGGADPNALDRRRYDLLTIAAVRDDVEMARLGLAGGANPGAVTSPYDGTALIAAAHLGHVAVVRELVRAGAPLDHVNNLGWTALIEAIVLGDGGVRHTEIVRVLVAAGAAPGLADREGTTPVAHARRRGYGEVVRILEEAGTRR
jgi:ankyrin repeat protein